MRRFSAYCQFAALVALTIATVTCDRAPTSPKFGHAVLSLRPQFATTAASSGSFGLNIDNVRVTVLRGEVPLKDTIVVFPASATEVDISLEVPLDASSVDATVTIQLRQQTTTYFSGTQPVTLQAVQDVAPITIPVTYVGPGQNVAFLSITPSATSAIAPTTITLRANAFDANEAAVADVPIGWSVSDTSVAAIAANGLSATLTPTGKRGSITVTATTPTGISATSTALAILPSAAKLTVLTGSGQSALIGSVLAQSFQVRVDGADNLPVPGVTVQFQSTTTGGSVTPSSAVSDTNGLAATTMKLGTLAGPYVFQASGAGFTAVTVSATALAGAPASIVATAGTLQTAVVGTLLPIAPTVVVKDASGNPISGIGVTFTASPSSGTVTTGTTFSASVTANTDATGTAKVSWKLGALAGADTLTVSVGTLPPILFIANGTAGPAAIISSLAPLDSAVSPGQALDVVKVKVTDAGGVNGVDGIPVTFTALFGTCSVGGTTQVTVNTSGGGFASVQPQLSPNATSPSSCAIEANATNSQSLALSGSPVWFKRYLIDPASTTRFFTGSSSTAWTDAKNWWKGVVPATTDVVWIPTASIASHPAVLSGATTIGSLTTEGAGQIDLNSNTLTVSQNFDASAGGVVQNGTLQLTGKGATATGAVQSAVVQGTSGCGLGSSLSIGAGGFFVNGTFTANCTVDATAGGALQVNGASLFTGQGALFMGANSIVNFLGDVTFAGGASSIAGGTIQVTGNFAQTAGTFAPAAATQMIFTGQGAQTITLANSQSTLPNLWIENSVGVTLNPLTVAGLLTFSNTVVLNANSRLTIAPNVSATISPPVGTGVPALVLFQGSLLTLNSSTILRFGTPTPGCQIHTGPPPGVINVNGGTISDSKCTQITP